MGREGGRPGWGSLSLAGRVWLVGFVVVMLAVPIVGGVAAARPAPFSWHMYSGSEVTETYEVERDGERQPADVGDWVVRSRGEPWARQGLPDHLCRSDETVDAVWVQRQVVTTEETDRERWPCRR